MNSSNEEAKILAALASIEHRQAGDAVDLISDETLANFITGSLSASERERVLAVLASHPARLQEAVQARQALAMSELEQSQVALAETRDTSLSGRLKKWYLGLGGAGGFALAAVAYVMFLPVITINDLDTQLQQSYSQAKFDVQQAQDNIALSKSFPLFASKLKEDVDFGENSAQVVLGVTTTEFGSRECESEEDCEAQKTAILLGRWIALNRIQCESSTPAANSFYVQQADIYQQLVPLFSEHYSEQLNLQALNLEHKTAAQSAVCNMVQTLEKAQY